MSKQYPRYKKIVHRMHEKTYGYENISRQPHCNDRWRQLRKLYGLNPQYYLAGEGQNTIWMNAFEEEKNILVDQIVIRHCEIIVVVIGNEKDTTGFR